MAEQRCGNAANFLAHFFDVRIRHLQKELVALTPLTADQPLQQPASDTTFGRYASSPFGLQLWRISASFSSLIGWTRLNVGPRSRMMTGSELTGGGPPDARAYPVNSAMRSAASSARLSVKATSGTSRNIELT